MIHDWNSVVEKHAQTMLQLLYLVCVWETWRTKADRENSSSTDCERDRRCEQIFDCVEEYPRTSTLRKSKCFLDELV